MSSSKKFIYLSEAQNFIPPFPYTLYTCIRVYSILIDTGMGGGGELNQREN